MTETSALAELLEGYSIEVTTRARAAIEFCRAHLARGTEVYIAFVPRDSYHDVVEATRRLSAAGLVAVPHIPARRIASFTQLGDFLARLAGEGGVSRALVIGGDSDPPLGPYRSSLELIRSELLQKHGFRRIGLACYPEAHRRIGAEALDQALSAKLDYLRHAGLEAWLVSQFCFSAAPIVERAAQLRAARITAPLRVGIAGPADRRTLWKYALHCGIGNSVRALGAEVDAVSNLLVRQAPDELLRELAAARGREPTLGIEGIHIFTFGGVASAATWANAILGRA